MENTEMKNCSGCENIIEIYNEKHDKVKRKSEESKITPENSVCKSLVNNREIFERHDYDKNVSDSAEMEKTKHCLHNQQVKFHNPSRHVFNLAVKVS